MAATQPILRTGRGYSRLTHGHTCGRLCGLKPSREYRIWSDMRDRCNRPRNKAYKHYGGRGIKVCERWNDFSAFLADMGPRPSPSHEIDRIDNNGNYEPGNCRWTTRKRNCRNTRGNHVVTFQGKSLCIAEWAERTGIPARTLWIRLRRWSVKRSLTTPVRPMAPRGLTRSKANTQAARPQCSR